MLNITNYQEMQIKTTVTRQIIKLMPTLEKKCCEHLRSCSESQCTCNGGEWSRFVKTNEIILCIPSMESEFRITDIARIHTHSKNRVSRALT